MTTAVDSPSENKPLATQRLGTLDLTRPEQLPEAVFRQKLQVLDLLVERIATSGNPRFVVQYLALLEEVERILAAILAAQGTAVSPYLVPAQEATPTTPSGKRPHLPKGAARPVATDAAKPIVALPPLATEVLHTQAEPGRLQAAGSARIGHSWIPPVCSPPQHRANKAIKQVGPAKDSSVAPVAECLML
jgi:hypothetical protein